MDWTATVAIHAGGSRQPSSTSSGHSHPCSGGVRPCVYDIFFRRLPDLLRVQRIPLGPGFWFRDAISEAPSALFLSIGVIGFLVRRAVRHVFTS
jgi:hypothetical protein